MMKFRSATYLMIAILLAAGCAKESYLGTKQPGAIEFAPVTGRQTKAETGGADAAAALGQGFVVKSTKTLPARTETVFDHYSVKWGGEGWYYSGVAPQAPSTASSQSFKFWDKDASRYDFAAFSGGDASGLTLSAMDFAKIGTSNAVYTVSGDAAQLARGYVSNHSGVLPADYGTNVKMVFRSLAARVRLAFYETVPNYSVQDLEFYTSASASSGGATASLYASSAFLPAGATTLSVSYPADGIVPVVKTSSAGASAVMAFGEPTSAVISQYASDPTYAGDYLSVLPLTRAGSLDLRVSYTLVPNDGTTDRIRIDAQPVSLPAEYTALAPNYAYTFIFKISADQLQPITFDAVSVVGSDGLQETITFLEYPSITSYQSGGLSNAHRTGNIYIVVADGDDPATAAPVELTSANIRLMHARVTADAVTTVIGTTVGRAAANMVDGVGSWTDSAGGRLIVTEIGPDDPDHIEYSLTKIPATDSPDGADRTVNCARFKAVKAGYYAVEYTDSEGNKYYKVLLIDGDYERGGLWVDDMPQVNL